jgi:hypothetical protein
VAGARSGDPAALARLVAGGPQNPSGGPDLSVVSPTLFLATTCEENGQGFDRTTASPDDRIAQARQRLAMIPASAFAPFGPDLAFLISFVPACAHWPLLPDAPTFGPGPPANVPVLLVHGEFDLRTPLANTQEVAALFPQSKILVVPNEGHSAASSDITGCAEHALAAFFNSGTAPAACPRKPDPFAPRPLAPRSLRGVTPAKGFAHDPAAGRMVAAAELTVADALEQLDFGSGGSVAAEAKVRGGGLRGGTFKGTSKGPRLNRYVFAGGVPVSGLVTRGGTVVLTVPGGVLRFAANGTVSGTLRGKPVVGRARLDRLTLARKLAPSAKVAALARPLVR